MNKRIDVAYDFCFKFPRNCVLKTLHSDSVVIRCRGRFDVTFPHASPREAQLIVSLLGPGISWGSGDDAMKEKILSRLFAHGFFVYELRAAEQVLLSALVELPLDIKLRGGEERYLPWAPFLSFSTNDGTLRLRSTEAYADVEVARDLAHELVDLSYHKEVSRTECRDEKLFLMLENLKFLVATDPLEKFWEEHDRVLLAKTRMRSDLDSREIGAVYPFEGPPPNPPRVTGRKTIKLLESDGPVLPAIFRARESKRRGDRDTCISFQELSTFLRLLTGKIREESGTNHRIFPVAGNIDAPEFLVINRSCEGLPPGIYFFDAATQELALLDDDRAAVKVKMDVYSNFWFKENGVPQLVIQVVRHYPSLAWKYRGINLKVLLVEAGGVLQSAQLLASHLGLSCCPLGLGPVDLIKSSGSTDLAWDRVPLMEFTLEK